MKHSSNSSRKANASAQRRDVNRGLGRPIRSHLTKILLMCLVSSPSVFAQGVVVGLAIDAEGQVGIGTESPSAALDVVGNIHASGNLSCYQDIWSSGSLTVDGNITSRSTIEAWGDLLGGGNLALDGAITSQGSITTQGAITSHDRITSTEQIDSYGQITAASHVIAGRDLRASGGLFFKRFYHEYSVVAEDKPNHHNKHKDMGTWDLCFLTKVSFSGIDDGEKHKAKCYLDVSGTGSRSDGPSWTLRAAAEEKVDKASCRAMCISFTGQDTGS